MENELLKSFVKVYHHIDEFKGCNNAVVTTGTFDGVHVGHQKILAQLKRVAEARKGEIIFGLTLMVSRGRTVFIADTNVHDNPTAEQLVQIAISSTRVAKLFGFDKVLLVGLKLLLFCFENCGFPANFELFFSITTVFLDFDFACSILLKVF